MKSGVTKAQAHKAIRQEALRELLSKGKHAEHVIDIANKLSSLDTEITPAEATRLKAAADIKMKLIDKYLPNLQAVELETQTPATTKAEDLTDDQLAAIATGSSTAHPEATPSKEPLH